MKQLSLYFLLAILLCSISPAFAQLPSCTDDFCGPVTPEWRLGGEGQTSVCEGTPFELDGSSSNPLDNIDDFHWFVLNETNTVVLFDTVLTTPNGFSYLVDLPDSVACDISSSSINFWVALQVTSPPCDDGKESCWVKLSPLKVNLRPRARFEAKQTECINTPIDFIDQSCHGTTYLWNFGDGATSAEANPSHTYSSTGTFTVTLTVNNDCVDNPSTFRKTVNIVGEPEADFDYTPNQAEDLCVPATISFTDKANEWSNTRWEITPLEDLAGIADTLLWCFTDTLMNLNTDNIRVRFKRPGKYLFKQIASNACDPDEKIDTIEIFERPNISLSEPPPSCDEITLSSNDLNFSYTGSLTNIRWTFENASGTTSIEGESFENVLFEQRGSITLIADSPCDGEIRRTIEVAVASTAPIVFGDNPSEICQNESSIQLNASDGGIWQARDRNNQQLLPDSVISTSGELLPMLFPEGDYWLVYVAGTSACPNRDSIEVAVLPSVGVQLVGVPPECDRIEINTSDIVSYSGDISTFKWTTPLGEFTEATPILNFNSADTYLISIVVEGQCGTDTAQIEVVVQDNTPIEITPINQPICAGSSPIDLEVNVAGGKWELLGNQDAIIDDSLGLFDPSLVSPSTYTITYSFLEGACNNIGQIEVEVVASATANIDNKLLCTDNEPVILSVNVDGGNWRGEGVVDTMLGIFDPSIVPAEGIYEIFYDFVDENGCEVNARGEVEVENLPTLNLRDTIQLCLSDFEVNISEQLTFEANPSDNGEAIWMGDGITDSNGQFNPVAANLGVGFHKIYVTYERNACSVLDSAVVELIEARPLEITPDTTLCISEITFQLNANLEGGTWSSNADIDANGLINLETTGGGEFTYQYAYLVGTSCQQEANGTIEIIDLRNVVNAGDDVQICSSTNAFQFTDASPAGFWSNPGLIDTLTGELNIPAFVLDSLYTFRYTIESEEVAACAAFDEKTFIIHSDPQPNFELDGLACIGETFTLNNLSENATRFEWNFGDGNTSANTSPTHQFAQKGTYTIHLTAIRELPNGFECTANLQEDFYITTPPEPAFTLASPNEGCAPFEVILGANNSSGDDLMQRWIIAGDTIIGATFSDIFLDSILVDSLFTIRLEAFNQCGLVPQEQEILVHPQPIADFGIEQDEGCSPSVIDFASTALGQPDNLIWIFDNGEIYDGNEPPTQIYTTTDTFVTTYYPTLIAINECGMDTISKEITVFPPNVEAFIELDTLSGCAPFEVQLKSFSTPGAEVSWRILDENGNQENSDLKDPVVTLSTPGIHTILLSASNCGTDMDTAYIEVFPAPDVRFEVSSPYACENAEIALTNLSNDLRESEWSFGDGTFSEEDSPSHIYAQTGFYTISLTGYSKEKGCPATFELDYEVKANPIPSFTTSDRSGCAPLVVQFTDASAGSNSLEYVWNFGDDSSDSFDQNPSHIYTEPGNYVVTLSIKDEFQCSADTSISNIFVHDFPVSAFQFENKSYCLGYDRLQTENLSEDAVSYEWQFQGQTYTTSTLDILPEQAGNFEIVLITQNEFQCRDTVRQTILIKPSPQADFQADQTEGCEDLSVQFSNASTDADTYLWRFDGFDTATDLNTSYLFTEAGEYSVQLIASNNNGCPSDSQQLNIQVWEKPLADFDFLVTEECGTPVEVIFRNLSANNLDYGWDFGDGGSANTRNARYTYQRAALYTASLVVKTEFGCADTMHQTVDVFEQPFADFSIEPQLCNGKAIQIENNSTNSTDFIWKIESFPVLQEANPTVIFDSLGSYDIQLIAIYNDKCRDTFDLADAVTVYQSPIADFNYRVNVEEDIIGDVEFESTSIFADALLWNLGDGNTDNRVQFIHEYDINRSIPVELIAYNLNNGAFTCTDTTRTEVDPEWQTAFHAPNAFTPEYGSDEIRVFRPVGIGIVEYNISVYSPWGNLVWYSEELNGDAPAEAWDGVNVKTGEILPQGTYAWRAIVTYVNGERKSYQGTVTILR